MEARSREGGNGPSNAMKGGKSGLEEAGEWQRQGEARVVVGELSDVRRRLTMQVPRFSVVE